MRTLNHWVLQRGRKLKGLASFRLEELPVGARSLQDNARKFSVLRRRYRETVPQSPTRSSASSNPGVLPSRNDKSGTLTERPRFFPSRGDPLGRPQAPSKSGTLTERPRFFPRGDPLGRPQAPSAQSPPPCKNTCISHKAIRSIPQAHGRISHGAVNSMSQ